jgi:hypothetical protein
MLTMEQYWQYVRATTEENPLYLFDRWFAQNVPCLAADWEVSERQTCAVRKPRLAV